MYERTVDQIDRLHGAVARLMTNEPCTPGSLLQSDADAALLLNHSMREQPVNLIDHLRHDQ